MKAPHGRNPRIDKVHPQTSPATQKATSASKPRKPSKDEAATSPHAAEVRKLTEMVRNLPDVRKEKIEAIKKQIETGTYNVSAESVAKNIIESVRRNVEDER